MLLFDPLIFDPLVFDTSNVGEPPPDPGPDPSEYTLSASRTRTVRQTWIAQRFPPVFNPRID